MLKALSLKSYCLQIIGIGAVRLGLRFGRSALDDEQKLILAARNGDRIAFDRLMDRHREALLRFLRTRVDRGEAEDIGQETWLAAFERIKDYRDSGRFRAWIFGICMHKVSDHRRSKARHLVYPEDVNYGYLPDDFKQVDLRESLRPVWSQLAASHREVLELYYGADLTLPEIASVIGCNLNMVKYRFYRAHDQVAAHLGGAAAFPFSNPASSDGSHSLGHSTVGAQL